MVRTRYCCPISKQNQHAGLTNISPMTGSLFCSIKAQNRKVLHTCKYVHGSFRWQQKPECGLESCGPRGPHIPVEFCSGCSQNTATAKKCSVQDKTSAVMQLLHLLVMHYVHQGTALEGLHLVLTYNTKTPSPSPNTLQSQSHLQSPPSACSTQNNLQRLPQQCTKSNYAQRWVPTVKRQADVTLLFNAAPAAAAVETRSTHPRRYDTDEVMTSIASKRS